MRTATLLGVAVVVLLALTISNQIRASLRVTTSSTAAWHSLSNDLPVLGYSRLQETSSPNSTINLFYNIYTAPDDVNAQVSLSIVHEQLEQIRDSHPLGTLTVFYNTIGNQELSLRVMDRTCATIFGRWHRCKNLQHYDEAFEEVTLTALHNFCLNPSTPASALVVYLHNKGSYHDRGVKQTEWRRHGTLAALNCLQHMIEEPETCNVCGLLWSPFPVPHFPGNFWTAECGYVRQLLSPQDFTNASTVFAHQVFTPMIAAQNLTAVLWRRPRETKLSSPDLTTRVPPTLTGRMALSRLGMGRFANEHWICSHPTIHACDVSNEPDLEFWQQDHHDQPVAYKWASAPRFLIHAPYRELDTIKYQALLPHDEIRLREFFLLPGLLLKQLYLYNQTPPSNSWMWKFYPDGQVWKQALLDHGRNAHAIIWQQIISRTMR